MLQPGICSACLDERYLQDLARTGATEDARCEVCEATPALPMDAFMPVFLAGVRRRWGNPADEGVPLEADGEDGYLTMVYDSFRELIENEFDDVGGPTTRQAIAESISYNDEQLWTRKDWDHYFPDELLLTGWEALITSIAERGRFLAAMVAPDPDFRPQLHPQQLLERIGEVIDAVGLIKTLPAGSRFWRARTSSTPKPTWSASDLGTPPTSIALGANRMSPVGIPLFYGGEDLDTAVAETTYRGRGGDIVEFGAFELERELSVLDLTTIPAPPSIFDVANGANHFTLTFLNAWAKQLSAAFPASEDRASIDYIPTQVTTEYFMRLHRGSGSIDGIRYNSVQNTGGVCVALDIPHKYCVPTGTPAEPRDKFVAKSVPDPHRLLLDPTSRASKVLRIVATTPL
jgi:hypothetical protein